MKCLCGLVYTVNALAANSFDEVGVYCVNPVDMSDKLTIVDLGKYNN